MIIIIIIIMIIIITQFLNIILSLHRFLLGILGYFRLQHCRHKGTSKVSILTKVKTGRGSIIVGGLNGRISCI